MNQKDTFARFHLGRKKWNEWAQQMLSCRQHSGALKSDYAQDDFADFREYCFEEEVDFSGFTFPGNVSFKEAIFSKGARFCGAIFLGAAGFVEAKFLGPARFDKAQFKAQAEFSKARFEDDARFIEIRLFAPAEAWFTEATFNGPARFNEARFGVDEGVSELTADYLARIDRAELHFPGGAAFNEATFNNRTTFQGAHFFRSASFQGARAGSFFSLRGATFHELPDFEQAHFSEAPRIDVRSLKGLSEPPPADRDRATDETTRWRALKRLAIQAHDYESEQHCFAQEIKSLRGTTDWLLPRPWNIFCKKEPLWRGGARYWFGLLYQLFSDFGRSIIRPSLWLVAATILFAGYYLFQHSAAQPRAAKGTLECSEPIVAALYLSIHKASLFAGLGGSDKLAQTFACLYGTNENFAAVTPIVPDAVAFAGFIQTFLSATFIFLILLAIRNQFRIK